MSKIIAPNYTQIPNVVLDEWIKILTYPEFKILMIMCRKTFGWHKTKDKVSYNQLSDMTGVCKNTVISSLKKLEEYGLIKKTISKNKKGFNNTNTYEIAIKDVIELDENIKSTETGKSEFGESNTNTLSKRTKKKKGDKDVAKDEGGVVHEMHHGSASDAPTKETNTKEIKKDISKDISKEKTTMKEKQIKFNKDTQELENITDEYLLSLKKDYRLVDIDAEFKEIIEWLCYHPGKKNYKAFIKKWLEKAQKAAEYCESRQNRTTSRRVPLRQEWEIMNDNRPDNRIQKLKEAGCYVECEAGDECVSFMDGWDG